MAKMKGKWVSICLVAVWALLFVCGGKATQSYAAESGKDLSGVEWLIKKAEQGDVLTQNLLGSMYDEGRGVAQDEREAVKWYTKAAELGDAFAQFKLGLRYDSGLGVVQDYREAVKWYTKAAEQGYVFAQLQLGLRYDRGQGVDQDYHEAVKWFNKAAEHGDASAQLQLGLRYDIGQGITQDYPEAVRWYGKAAEQGNASAQYCLGSMYVNGHGVVQDYREAAKWFSKAAEQGNALAQYNLGLMYDNGQGVVQSYREAVKWYAKAADQGNALAQNNLAMCYYKGQGVVQDYREAVKWYGKAAEQGNALAQNNLATSYSRGQGVAQDYREAVKWYTKAAEQGNSLGQLNLGAMYGKGEGVPQNYIYSYAWSSLAAAQGEPAKNRDIASKYLASQQLMEAQTLAARLQDRIDHPENKTEKHLPQGSPAITAEQTTAKVRRTGSGFVISTDGYFLTCYHVIKDGTGVKVKLGAKEYPAELIRADKYNDIALIKIKGNFQPLPFASGRSAKMGQDVFTVGFPDPLLQGINAKLTKGEVSSLTGYRDDTRMYQVSIPVQPGSSGGPLLDTNGNVAGVIVAMLDAQAVFALSGSLPQNVNYAIKSSYAQALLDSVPELANNLATPTAKQTFDKAVEAANKAVGMVVVYE